MSKNEIAKFNSKGLICMEDHSNLTEFETVSYDEFIEMICNGHNITKKKDTTISDLTFTGVNVFVIDNNNGFLEIEALFKK